MWRHYLFMARPDHWFKNVFVLPGAAIAVLLTQADVPLALWHTLVAVVATCFIASANYVINEWLDAQFDRHHPVKKNRPAASGLIKFHWVLVEYAALVALGLGIAASLSLPFLGFAALLLLMGVFYNVPPVRTKDRAYLDVLSESFNNPLRFLLGWSAVTSTLFPPTSILLAYWMGGAFLMAVKRYAEYRFIGDAAQAGQYRRSFRFYTEQSLLLSSFFYAITSSFFLAIFLVKYRVEFLLSFPLFALLFVWYLAIGMRPLSPSQSPEKLYREKPFMAFLLLLVTVVVALYLIDLPFLHQLVEPLHYAG